jgi:hypothetical protein
MSPVADWRAVLRHAWSIRLIVLSILLNAAAAALMFGDALPISPLALVVLTFATNVAALVARVVAQRQLGGAS